MDQHSFEIKKDVATGKWCYETYLKGWEILEQPILNKGTSFHETERAELGLKGLLPYETASIEVQLQRTYEQYKTKTTDLERHIYLRALQDRNEILFYRLVIDHIDEMLPMIYTPVVGEACQHFHEIYRKPRGLYIAYPDRDQIDEILANWHYPEVKVIVVSDGERILGLGDQGVGGMGIPIGKISLYTACGGIHPAYGLPIILDVGTDNEERLQDPLYFGWQHKRIRGEEYKAFIEKFVQAVIKRFPHALLQWEDFAKDHARNILDSYHDRLCTFNDDIQGTAAVVLAGLLAATKATKTKLRDQVILFSGAGSAGTGIADQMVAAMIQEGLSAQEACARIWMVDIDGLLLSSMDQLMEAQKPYAKSKENIKEWKIAANESITLERAVANLHPTVLIGVSGTPGVFHEKLIGEMAAHTPRPIIFPLSNPTSRCEAAPEDLIQWTEGRALIATGTYFSPVHYKNKTYSIGQCNNCYIFPGMGLAVVASGATRVTKGMFLAAASALSELAPALSRAGDSLFPTAKEAQKIAKKVAIAVVLQAQKEELVPAMSTEEAHKRIEEAFWDPHYDSIHCANSMMELKRKAM